MTVTFHIESSPGEEGAPDAAPAPRLDVHDRGAALLLTAARVAPSGAGHIDADELLDRLRGPRFAHATHPGDVTYLAHRLGRLQAVAVAARAVHRRVVWEGGPPPTARPTPGR